MDDERKMGTHVELRNGLQFHSCDKFVEFGRKVYTISEERMCEEIYLNSTDGKFPKEINLILRYSYTHKRIVLMLGQLHTSCFTVESNSGFELLG